MIVFKISRKLLKITVITALAVSLGFNIYSYSRYMKLTKKYETLIHSSSRTVRINMSAFLASADVQVQENKNVEIFDVSEGKVIKKVKPNSAVQKEAESFLKGITGVYVKVKAFPDKGYIIKIPLEPPAEIRNQWLNDTVDEVFIIFPEQGKPYLLVLDDKYRPLFYTFEGNTDEMLKSLNFQPAASQ